MSRVEREVHGRRISFTSLDKPFFPEDGYTKGDVVAYYERIAPVMLPHVKDRFLSMHRFPDGIHGEHFYQKDTPDWFPDWVRTLEVEKEGGTNCQVAIEEPATLAYLAQQGTLTPHIWLSRIDAPRRPDRMVFDFDPSAPWEEAFDSVRWAARRLREVLEQAGLSAFVLLSGSRGVHVHVPLVPDADFDVVKPFARGVCEVLATRYPERLTTEVRKAKREGRIFLDYLRNEWAQTAVAPYALRARPGAPVATPVAWEELSRSGMGPRRYTLANIFRRLSAKGDPWVDMDRHARSLREVAQVGLEADRV